MNKLIGVVTSDWHLEGMNKVLGYKATALQMKEIKKPFEYALKHGIKNVFIPGDASDTPKMSEHSLIALLELLLTYDDYLNVWYITGNHDFHMIQKGESKTSFDLVKFLHDNHRFKNFKLITTVTNEKVDGVDVAFVPFPHLEYPKRKKPSLVFAHIETVGAMGDNGLPLRLKEDTLKRHPGDFVISGHIHQYQHMKGKRLIYCGSLYQKNFGEKLPKGFIEFEAKYVTADDGSTRLRVTHEFVDSNPNFVLETRVITSNQDLDSLSDDPNRKYKLLFDRNDVTVPKDLTKRFPNIVMLNGIDTTNKVEMAQVQATLDGLTVKSLPSISMKTGLLPFLKQSGLQRSQRDQARKFVEEAIKALNIV